MKSSIYWEVLEDSGVESVRLSKIYESSHEAHPLITNYGDIIFLRPDFAASSLRLIFCIMIQLTLTLGLSNKIRLWEI